MRLPPLTLSLAVLARVALASVDDEDTYSVEGTVKLEVEVPRRAPAPLPTPPVAEAPKAKVSAGQIVTLESVYFVTGSPEVKQESLPVLDAVAALLRGAPQLARVRIEAHTDSVAGANVALSQGRADWVRAYLQGKGVAAERLSAVGYGAARLIATNSTRAGRQLNRRVEFVIVGATRLASK
jgi:outer membrane protein OmpA-like peptidoglycan-associated protein